MVKHRIELKLLLSSRQKLTAGMMDDVAKETLSSRIHLLVKEDVTDPK